MKKYYWFYAVLVTFIFLTACGPKQSPEDRFLNNFRIGSDAMLNEDYEKALKHFWKAFEIQNRNPKLYHQMAICFEKLNQPDSAIVYYEGAIVFNPKNIEAYQQIGKIFYQKGMFHEAMTWYDKAMELGYLKPESYIRLAEIRYKWREYDWAKKYYEYAIISDSTRGDSYFGLGQVYLAEKDTALAESNFLKAVDYGSHAEAAYMLGLISFSKQDYDEALKWFAAYLKLEPDGRFADKAKEYQMIIKIKQKFGED